MSIAYLAITILLAAIVMFSGIGKIRRDHSLRHTFLTRLGESGCDAWTLARIAGHSSVAMSARYVHPSEDAVLNALDRLSGHNSGHSENASANSLAVQSQLSSSND
jgi:integrase